MTTENSPPVTVDVVVLGGVEVRVVSFPLPDDAQLAPLTPAEREVALLAMRGLSSSAIAEERSTSTRTVANQLASIFRKLGVSGRAELAASLVDPE